MVYTAKITDVDSDDDGLKVTFRETEAGDGQTVTFNFSDFADMEDKVLDFVSGHRPEIFLWLLWTWWKQRDPSGDTPSVIINKTFRFDPESNGALS